MSAAELLGSVKEAPTQNRIVEYLYRICPPGTVVSAAKNEATAPGWADTERKRAAYYGRRNKNGVYPGIPDLTVYIPRGVTVLIETKRPGGGQLSESQKAAHKHLAEIGFTVGVAKCEEDARNLLLSAGVKLRNVTLPPLAMASRPPDKRKAPRVTSTRRPVKSKAKG